MRLPWWGLADKLRSVNANREATFLFIVLAAVLAILLLRLSGPRLQPADAPDTVFSSARAVQALHDLLVNDAPHPVGTAAHDAVLGRLVTSFQQRGYQPEVRRGFGCTADAFCAPVANVVAELPGDTRTETLLVTAHYDSVPAGPGASDDGVGVAVILEVARAVRHERFRNTIRFLITDGEEAGLLGAEAIARDLQFLRGVAAVINIENRGTSGSSFLFETSPHNRSIIPVVARAMTRPSTSSLFYEVYRLLPNDTDLTVFKRLGLAGINFAAIGHVAHYHTLLDSLEHVQPALVQDHGEHVLAMTRAFANAGLRQSSNDNAIFFDVFSLFMLWWPQRWTTLIAVIILIVLILGALGRIRSRSATPRGIIIGIMSFFVSILAAAAAGALAAWLIALRCPAAIWAAHPGPSIAAAWLIGITCAVVVAAIAVTRAESEGVFIGHAICWSALGIALAQGLPGVSYIAIVPAGAFALAVASSKLAGADLAIGSIICAVIGAILLFPLGLLFYDAFGRAAIVVIAAVLALVSTTFTPLVARDVRIRRAAVSSMSLIALVCIAMQLVIPPFTRESPRRLNVRYVDDGDHMEWQADALTPPLRKLSFDQRVIRRPWLWSPLTIAAAATPRLPLAEPEARVIMREPKHLVVQIRSRRRAQRIALTLHSTRTPVVRVNGMSLPSEEQKTRSVLAPGWHRIVVLGAVEATIDLYLQQDETIDAYVSDYSYGLPPEAANVVRARDASVAVPSDDGDGILMIRRVRL